MLERAAGCLENAGRRLFRDSNGAIRGQGSLALNRVHCNGGNQEGLYRHNASVLPQTHQLPDSSSRVTSDTSTPTHDLRPPFLDFLYPPRTQEFAASCLVRSPRRLVPRRKQKGVPSFVRSYSSATADAYSREGTDHHHETATLEQKDKEREYNEAKSALVALLDIGDIENFEEAWSLYNLANCPADVHSAFLAYMSQSNDTTIHRRARRLFEEIPLESRSSEDFLFMTKSYLRVKASVDVKRTCEEALLQSRGMQCYIHALAYYTRGNRWGLLQELWDMTQEIRSLSLKTRSLVQETIDLIADTRDAISATKIMIPGVPDVMKKMKSSMLETRALYDPRTFEDEILDSLIHRHLAYGVPNILLELSEHLQKPNAIESLRRFALRLLHHAFRSLPIVERAPTETLLSLLRTYNNLALITPEHYFDLIETLISSENRTIFVRSMLVYRSFRWQIREVTPPEKLLNKLVRRLQTFDITSGIQYLLDEFTHFHGKPTIDLYQRALSTFARIGDVTNVNRIFEQFTKDHGKPLSRKIITPLLYVHARVGDVQETQNQFARVPAEFNLELNNVCWSILLAAYAKVDDLNAAFSVFQKMLDEGTKPNSHIFGTLMGMSAKRGDIETVRSLLALAKKHNVQVTTPMVDTIVETYCLNGKFDLAESIAEMCLGLEMVGSRIRMWNKLLWEHAYRIDLVSMNRIRLRMEEAGLRPDEMTYAALMISLVLIHRTDTARRLLRTLHRSKRVYVREFHYAIILYGYVRDRNRDMVRIIFQEIKKRFLTPGFSSQLLLLKSQLQRDLSLLKTEGESAHAANLRLHNGEKTLAAIVANFDSSMLATKEPQPGAARQPLPQTFPATYYQYMIRAYGSQGASEQVERLFNEFIANQKGFAGSENMEDIAPLRLLTALMSAHLKAENHEKLEDCWKLAFPKAVKAASRPDIDEWLSHELSPLELDKQPPRPVHSHDDVVLDSAQQQPTILPACRFMLSRPLSIYMRSLAYRNEPHRIHDLVADVQAMGFALTTHNWSTLVQMLTTSPRVYDVVTAFTIFEEKFMPNFPGWKYLRKGWMLKPHDVPATIDLVESPRTKLKPRELLGKQGRRWWMSKRPDFMQPTYITLVYLAASLRRARYRSISDGTVHLQDIFEKAPQTVEAVSTMPFLREKFQAVLLRNGEEPRDELRKDNLRPYVWTGGVLGVGGRRRRHTSEMQRPPGQEDAQIAGVSDASDKEASDDPDYALSPDEISAAPQRVMDPSDEHDMEIEADFEQRRRDLAKYRKLGDVEDKPRYHQSIKRKHPGRPLSLFKGENPALRQMKLEAGYSESMERESYRKKRSLFRKGAVEYGEVLRERGYLGNEGDEMPWESDNDADADHIEFPAEYSEGTLDGEEIMEIFESGVAPSSEDRDASDFLPPQPGHGANLGGRDE